MMIYFGYLVINSNKTMVKMVLIPAIHSRPVNIVDDIYIITHYILINYVIISSPIKK